MHYFLLILFSLSLYSANDTLLESEGTIKTTYALPQLQPNTKMPLSQPHTTITVPPAFSHDDPTPNTTGEKSYMRAFSSSCSHCWKSFCHECCSSVCSCEGACYDCTTCTKGKLTCFLFTAAIIFLIIVIATASSHSS